MQQAFLSQPLERNSVWSWVKNKPPETPCFLLPRRTPDILFFFLFCLCEAKSSYRKQNEDNLLAAWVRVEAQAGKGGCKSPGDRRSLCSPCTSSPSLHFPCQGVGSLRTAKAWLGSAPASRGFCILCHHFGDWDQPGGRFKRAGPRKFSLHSNSTIIVTSVSIINSVCANT